MNNTATMQPVTDSNLSMEEVNFLITICNEMKKNINDISIDKLKEFYLRQNEPARVMYNLVSALSKDDPIGNKHLERMDTMINERVQVLLESYHQDLKHIESILIKLHLRRSE